MAQKSVPISSMKADGDGQAARAAELGTAPTAPARSQASRARAGSLGRPAAQGVGGTGPPLASASRVMVSGGAGARRRRPDPLALQRAQRPWAGAPAGRSAERARRPAGGAGRGTGGGPSARLRGRHAALALRA